jgi:hypothetical protein
MKMIFIALSDSIGTAFYEGEGDVYVEVQEKSGVGSQESEVDSDSEHKLRTHCFISKIASSWMVYSSKIRHQIFFL